MKTLFDVTGSSIGPSAGLAMTKSDIEKIEEASKVKPKQQKPCKGYTSHNENGRLVFIVARNHNCKGYHFKRTRNEESAAWLAKHVSHSLKNKTIPEMHIMFRSGKKQEAIEKYGDPELSGTFSQYF